jgi:hypothetical protein
MGDKFPNAGASKVSEGGSVEELQARKGGSGHRQTRRQLPEGTNQSTFFI